MERLEPRLVVFAKDAQRAIWAKELDGGPSSWTTWGGGAQFSPAACSWGGRRLDLFVCGNDNALWHRWRDDDGAMHDWKRVGGELSESPAATARMAPRRIDVFARAPDLSLWTNTLTRKNGDERWSGWRSWGGSFRSAPTACSRAGYLEVFGEGDDSELWHTWTGVSGWHRLPPPADLAPSFRPACVAWGPGNISVLIRGREASDLVARDWVFNPFKGGALGSWHSWGGELSSGPAACSPGGKRVDVAARGTDGAIWHLHRHDAELDGATEMESLGGSWEGDPAMVAIEPALPEAPASELTWKRAELGGIEIDEAAGAYHSGRVIDLLRTRSGHLLAASAHAGVWDMDEGSTPLALSTDWDNPNTTCLAQGPLADTHVYAGCGNANISTLLGEIGGALYETDPAREFSLFAPWREVPLRAEMGSVTGLLVLSDRRVIVVACWGGVYWSPIPAAGEVYDWQRPHWADITGHAPAVFSVAAGTGGRVIAGAWDDGGGRQGIYVGEWSDILGAPPITMRRAAVLDASWSDLTRISVASCPAAAARVYALATDGGGAPKAVLRSVDGGLNWRRCPDKVTGAPAAYPSILSTGDDHAGGIMHQISVSAVDPLRVGFGILWPFGSFDGGTTWQLLEPWDGDDLARAHTHDDVHVVYFDPRAVDRLYIGSDGGLVRTEDDGKTFSSRHNRALPTLQFYSTFTREFFGRICASPVFPNLVAGGLQDNGNVYAAIGTTPWRPTSVTPGKREGGDGGQVIALENGWLVRSFMNRPVPRQTSWDAASGTLVDHGPVPVRSRDDEPLAESLTSAVMESALAPVLKNSLGERMYAVGAAETGKTTANAYGLFAESGGTHMHWEPIIDAGWTIASGLQVSAIGVGDGRRVFLALHGPSGAGPSGLQVIGFTPSNGAWAALGGGLPPLPSGGFISRLLVRGEGTVAFALHNIYPSVAKPAGSGRLLRTDNGGMKWDVVGGVPDVNIYGLDEDWTTSPPTLFLATDSEVLRSRDDGATWTPVNDGLPRRPHCSDLRFVAYPGGKRFLYLGTWGWSLWRAESS